jgi:vitamin B12 transporter
MVRLRTFLALILLLPAVAAAAETPEVGVAAESEIDVVYAYARRQRAADMVGSAVSVIDAVDIEDGQFALAVDALKFAPGVSVAQNGGPGGFASVRLRGASSGQTLVVIDGVVVNDPASPQGGFNFANLDVADIERIEVLRGPQGIIYGADAIGGVIAIRTKREAPGVSAYAEGGARGTARAGATVFGKSGGAIARATFSGSTTDGISRAAAGTEADGYRTIAGSFAGGADLGGRSKVSLFARASDSRADLDGFPPPFFSFADTDETEDATEAAISARFAHGGFDDEGPNDIAGALSASWTSVDRKNADLGAVTFTAYGERFSADYVAAATIGSALSIEAGGEVERASVDVSGVDQSANAAAVFALSEVTLFERLTVSVGARRDEFSNFEGATTARVALAYAFGERARLRFSWGEGFRAPTLFELNFDQFGVVPNPDLRPERATGFDAGIDFAIGAARLSATGFRQRVRDQIGFEFTRNGYYNIARVRSDGVEIELDAPLGQRASLHAAYSLTDARDAATDLRVLRTPKHSGSATLSIAPLDGLSLSAAAIFNGDEADFPTRNKAFARLDLRAAYDLLDDLQIYGRVENATDADYEDVSGYGEPGVSVFVGLRMRRW